ncbi:integral membrane protein [Actinomyces sp. Chiba101]|uniref:type II secretion system F family protein n=1 Tax=Actinomyces TaxID=1654 RepID=UPI000974F250|nr:MULTISPECIES: type II secretion system F family protein [Actinomyces]BAW94114.1 integral membrane protein [Actinomyces sp. Chiba101]SUU13784.1 Flp pilus assembly protein TadB [Actinomyces denticolens]
MIGAAQAPMLLAGAMIGGGAFLATAYLLGIDILPAPQRSSSAARGVSKRTLYALALGLGLLVLTRWVVFAASGAILVLVWPMFFGGSKEEKAAAARIEALATWAESLRDTIAGAVGLEQAIPATVYAAAPVIRDDLALLADRMRVRVSLPTALRQFADDLDDPTADLIISALIMNARLRGPGLRALLGSLAETARAELDMRQRVAASRAGTRRSAQMVLIFSLLVILGLALFNQDFVAPYNSAQGQLVLVVVAMFFALGMLWMRRLAGVTLPKRFLAAPVGEEDA